jgi:hypothetical protein
MTGSDLVTRDVRPANAGGACVVAPATAILAAREWRGNGLKAFLQG